MTSQKRLATKQNIVVDILISKSENTAFKINMGVRGYNIPIIKSINPSKGRIHIASSKMIPGWRGSVVEC